MTAGVLEQSPNQVAEQVSHARAMEIIEGAGMVVPESVAEIEAIVPFTQQFRTGVAANVPWISRDPVSGECHSVPPALYEGFIQTAQTLGDISYWRLDSEDTGMQGILGDPSLSHLHDYAEQRVLLSETISEHEDAQRLVTLRGRLAARDAFYGIDEDGDRGFFPEDDTQTVDMSTLIAPHSAPEQVVILPARRSRAATFFSSLVSRIISKK